ncbi:UNVERIFIED_CONTAM: aconitate hydratase [Acetivibrio alkalicellulosi]
MNFNKMNLSKKLIIDQEEYIYYDINALEGLGIENISSLPYSIKVLLENAVRNYDENLVTIEHIKRIASWGTKKEKGEIPFIPFRIVLQDFTGIPVVVDLAAMRQKIYEMGGEPAKINPIVPVDLVIDHSVIVDCFGNSDALNCNISKEFERNIERYKLLKWAQNSFSHFRVFPPSVGIVHQVNLEYLAGIAVTKEVNGENIICPDSLVGTDSHTTMINGAGVLGWGVGGIEAEAGMLGQPLYFLLPDVIGFKLTGRLPDYATATDLALTITSILRNEGVVGKFVEFYGEGVSSLNVEDRATISNMAPEYGATVAFFPVDCNTLSYLKSTGRSKKQISLVEAYYKTQGMFRTDSSKEPIFSSTLHLDLSTIEPSLAGPKRPQDIINLRDMKKNFWDKVTAPIDKGGYQLSKDKVSDSVKIKYKNGKTEDLKTGSIVIAAITSCTNTSNPYVMISAGLVAKKAVELGLVKPEYVKTSLAPGSLVVTDYLQRSGLLPYLEKLGFYIAGYGCTTCIGNSGPLINEVSKAVDENDITVAAVLSGNRNFEGRIHPQVKMNYLASPPLVVAYAIAGTVNIDLLSEPIALSADNKPVYLKDIWPDHKEIQKILKDNITSEMYINKYNKIFKANKHWNDINYSKEKLYKWDETSSYIKKPPFFNEMKKNIEEQKDLIDAKVLIFLGDSVTTDHISPAGAIPFDSPAAKYLLLKNIDKDNFNSYGSRRGNHQVMVRGTFANIRIRNKMVPGIEGGFTRHISSNEITTVYEACNEYNKTHTPLIVIAGKEYGSGSSRDWAAKGAYLLGVKAVIAESFERIHRSNLVGMGILPLQFINGTNADSLGITGNESFDITGISQILHPNQKIKVFITRNDGSSLNFDLISRLDSNIEIEYYRNGGILNMVLRNFLK